MFEVLGAPGAPMGAGVGQGMGAVESGMPWGPPCHGTIVRNPWQSSRLRVSISWGSSASCTPGPPPHPPSAPRLQEEPEEDGAMSPGDKCPGPAEGPDPHPKAGGLSESRGVCWG